MYSEVRKYKMSVLEKDTPFFVAIGRFLAFPRFCDKNTIPTIPSLGV